MNPTIVAGSVFDTRRGWGWAPVHDLKCVGAYRESWLRRREQNKMTFDNTQSSH